MRVSVVIPVLDGARYLDEVLAAIDADEVLVVDSGSTDGSPAIARRHGAEVLEIAPESFGHGRTRNLAAERTTGDLIAFLTQDATPCAGWLDAYRAAFADPQVGVAYGPHLPRPGASPAIARELTEFFAAQDPAETFLSNVNACYRRACWEEIRFEDVPYSEDQAFGRAVSATPWRKVYVPDARVLHSHDYGPLEFMRRYFDEYRGLRRTSGHRERLNLRAIPRLVREDVRYAGPGAAPRSLVHHSGRRFFSALGSRHERLPAAVERRLSLEGTTLKGPGPFRRVEGSGQSPYRAFLERARSGTAPLLAPVPGMAEREGLHVALVIPAFRRGSGGHSTLFNLFTRLERRGWVVTVWVHDPFGRHTADWPGRLRGDIREFFPGPLEGPVFKGFGGWYGADIAVATGWETVAPVVGLDETRARAYVVQDHEPEFFPTSAEARWAEQTYAEDLHPIVCSPWLRDLMTGRYGAPSASLFDLAVDHGVYHPRPVERRRDTVIFYARGVTPRRGVPLGLLALEELHRRRPDVRIVMFGDEEPVPAAFPYEHLGVASGEELARAYSEATVGVCLSLTNYSLVPNEMLACGLPCVDLAGGSLEAVYGEDGPVELVPFDPVALAGAVERLLDDDGLHARRSAAGIEFAAGRTWEHATDQLEEALREALRERERAGAERPRILHSVGQESYGAAATTLARHVGVDESTEREVTERLYGRLTAADVEAIWAALEPDWIGYLREHVPDELHRKTLLLHLAAHYDVATALERTRLRSARPPEEVHAMARGPLADGGALYYGDMIEAALRKTGRSLYDVKRGLDFGSSSGRTVRVLAAAHPDAQWHGSDPNVEAIAWAREHLGDLVEFLEQPQDPPLPYPDGHFDLVVAISIWSHFAEGAALRWLDEMHRVIRPGGQLFMTVHAEQSVAYYAYTGHRSPRQLAEISEAMRSRGFWYAAEFGDVGDHGVLHSDWGTAFLTAEWLARHACPAWSIDLWEVGQNAHNQDVVVLTRR